MKKLMVISILLITCATSSFMYHNKPEYLNNTEYNIEILNNEDETIQNEDLKITDETKNKDKISTEVETIETIEIKTIEDISYTEVFPLYTEEELYIMSHLIMGEAEGESWEHKLGVGSVALNRVKDSRYPNTLKEVVFQKGQYACTWDGNYNKEPNKESIEAAKYLLENGSQLPEYCIFQAEFLQGDSVYKKVGNTYFCYYKKDVK